MCGDATGAVTAEQDAPAHHGLFVYEDDDALLDRMTLEEKTAQLGGFWVDQGDDLVAPMAGELASSTRYEDAT